VRLSLRARILLASSVLVAGLTIATLAYVNAQASRFADRGLVAQLEHGRDLVRTAQATRFENLQLAGRAVASFPALQALVSDTDAGTIRDFLLAYRERYTTVDVLMVLSPGGKIVARTDAISTGEIPNVESRWLQPALSSRGAALGVLAPGDTVYHAAVLPIEAGGTVFGYLVLGARIDDQWARHLREDSRVELLLLGATRVLGSTLRADSLPWRSRKQFPPTLGLGTAPGDIVVAGEHYRVLALASPDADGPLIVSLLSRDQALAPYRQIQTGLLILGLIAVAAGVAGSALLARSITDPVGRLREGTRQVAEGNYEFRIDVNRRDELGELATSFNQMTEGLRERAEMMKFVSQSTVEMIHAHTTAPTSAGERRDVTVLFSDIRGFTLLAERLPPEDAVALLNRCLSAQAGLVKKFHGDVDKFIGDAVFAIFSGDDMTLNAIRCAVEIHHTIERLDAGPAGAPLTVGVGIVSGEVILGSVGSVDRLDYTALGSNVNLCERLCSQAEARQILMSESTYLRVADLIAAEPIAALNVKGFTTPVRAYRMIVQPRP
jgi:class 3 adenylate cyclase